MLRFLKMYVFFNKKAYQHTLAEFHSRFYRLDMCEQNDPGQ